MSKAKLGAGITLVQPHPVEFAQGLLSEDELHVKEVSVLGTSPLAVALALLRERPLGSFAVALYGDASALAAEIDALSTPPDAHDAARDGHVGSDLPPVRVVYEHASAPRDVLREAAPGVRVRVTNVEPGEWVSMHFWEPIKARARVVFCLVPAAGTNRGAKPKLGVCPLATLDHWQHNPNERDVLTKEPDFVALRADDADEWALLKGGKGPAGRPPALKDYRPRLLLRVVAGADAARARARAGRWDEHERAAGDDSDPESDGDEHVARKRVKPCGRPPSAAERESALELEARRWQEWEQLRRRFDEWRDERGQAQRSDVRAVWDVYADALVRGEVDARRVPDEKGWLALEPREQGELLRSAALFKAWLERSAGADSVARARRATIRAARDGEAQRRFRELFGLYEPRETKEEPDAHWRRLAEKPWMLAALGGEAVDAR
ncbi:hypothetical protein T492DRAFT_976606 [Pavlovales sp. CCMP2436]|nr:hypothetical protein T492DRAFT_976606 [Pavlovales sp. CCMP2436]